MGLSTLLAALLVIAFCSESVALRPIVLVHGLFGDNSTWTNTKKYILSDFPDVNITEVTVFDGIVSLTTDMWTQVEGTYKQIHPVLDWAPDGVTLICYSQGMNMLIYRSGIYCKTGSISMQVILVILSL